MFGFHAPELVILLVVALIIFGPKRLPEIGGALGKGIKEFKRGTTDSEETVSNDRVSQIPGSSHTADIRVPEKTVEVASTKPERDAS